MTSCNLQTIELPSPPKVAWWEWSVVLLVLVVFGALGLSHLGGPSLWHDELVQVFVGQHIAEFGTPHLPGGDLYPSALAYNYLLGAVISAFGNGAVAVRTPSVVFGGLALVLLYLLLRRLLGRNTALLTITLLALSPWYVAWARQARPYMLQLTAYIAVLYCFYDALDSTCRNHKKVFTFLALLAYSIGMLTTFHSILFLGTIGGYAIVMFVLDKTQRKAAGVAIILCTLTGLITLLLLYMNPSSTDKNATFSTGIGGVLTDPQRVSRWYYFVWLKNNLSIGFLLLSYLGTVVLLLKERRRGLFLTLAFWVPVLVLTFLIGYRRPRFMFFAYPFYVTLSAYGLGQCLALIRHTRRQWHTLHHLPWSLVMKLGVSVILILFVARLSLSELKLVQDTLDTARGANTTLARRHPQWKAPCAWVKENANATDAILTTTWLPAAYYVGRVNNWFPNRYRLWEAAEAGVAGLGSLEELQAFITRNPRGYFIAEFDRFEKWRHHGHLLDTLGREVNWVQQNMKRVHDACSYDVTVYAWGMENTHE